MISQILSYKYTPQIIAGSILLGVSLIVGGAFGHTSAIAGSFCTIGSGLTIAGFVALALKIDHFRRSKKMEETHQSNAPYVPTADMWIKALEKNPDKVPGVLTKSYDPCVRGSLSIHTHFHHIPPNGIVDTDL